MRDGPPDWAMTESRVVQTTISAWRADRLLAADIGLLDGTAGWSAEGISSRLTFTTTDHWRPTGWDDPLAPYGQRLNVQQTVAVPGQSWTVNLGWFLVTAHDYEHPRVQVEAVSLSQLVQDYRFPSPYVRQSGATFGSTLADLLRGLLPVRVDLTDRTVPSSLTQDWDTDRLSALRALETNWPADIRVDDDGIMAATADRTVGSPARTWRHGQNGAYVTSGTEAARWGVYNEVTARGETANGTPVQATVYDDDPRSPTYARGPYGRRNRFYESPLIATREQARSAAGKILRQELRRTQQVRVTAPPDPRVEVGDTVDVVDHTGVTFRGLVDTVDLPLTAQVGPATYQISRETGAW